MNPSVLSGEITEDQLSKLSSILEQALLPRIDREAFQGILGHPLFQGELIGLFNKFSWLTKDCVYVRVQVDRNLSPSHVMREWTLCLEDDNEKRLFREMPRGYGQYEHLVFFEITERVSSVTALEAMFYAKGLKPASPYAVAKARDHVPVFFEKHGPRVFWKDRRECIQLCFGNDRLQGYFYLEIITGQIEFPQGTWFAGTPL